ncbi:MAG: RNA-binding S4 domain-containing protein [Pelosinus sp.]|nr:RNA-binding S4 domain-containing protein [Pelosinus sp.]
MEEVAITTETIHLDQFLKWAGVVESGGQVKLLMEDGLILINGVVAAERRKKVQAGDVIAIEGLGSWKVVHE